MDVYNIIQAVVVINKKLNYYTKYGGAREQQKARFNSSNNGQELMGEGDSYERDNYTGANISKDKRILI